MSLRCITVTSFGEAGTRFPSRFTMSWKTRLGCRGVDSCWLIPVPATRSMASLGLTHSFIPASESAAGEKHKEQAAKKNGHGSNLDLHDLPHDCVANYLQHNGARPA